MLQVPATVLNPPKPVYGRCSASVSNGSWNLRDVKCLTTFPKIVFKVFMIAIPDGPYSAIKGPEILQETFKEFQDVMQRSYSTATIQFVGMCPDPQFGRSEAEARISMEKAKAKGANFVMLFLENAIRQRTRSSSILPIARMGCTHYASCTRESPSVLNTGEISQ